MRAAFRDSTPRRWQSQPICSVIRRIGPIGDAARNGALRPQRRSALDKATLSARKALILVVHPDGRRVLSALD